MKYLLDTHLLLWTAANSPLLPQTVRSIIQDPGNRIYFSAASIWEIAIKSSLKRPHFEVDPAALQQGLVQNGYLPLSLIADHAQGVRSMPLLHKDPFDRILIAQATAEGMTLLTEDSIVARYPGPIRKV